MQPAKSKQPKNEPPSVTSRSFAASARVSVQTFVADIERPGDVGAAEVSQIKIQRTTGANPASIVITPAELPILRVLLEEVEKVTLPALMEYGKVEPAE